MTEGTCIGQPQLRKLSGEERIPNFPTATLPKLHNAQILNFFVLYDNTKSNRLFFANFVDNPCRSCAIVPIPHTQHSRRMTKNFSCDRAQLVIDPDDGICRRVRAERLDQEFCSRLIPAYVARGKCGDR